MKKKILSYVLYIALAIITASCIDPNENNNVEITVVTSAPTEITSSTAQCGGQVTTTSSVFISELGVCWGFEEDPVATGSHFSTTATGEPFSCTLTGLQPETQYYYRAYALYESEYHYGANFNFTTLANNGGEEPDLPEGLISGLFSVSESSLVYFSRGNLQYQASTSTWRFAEHQWDFVGYSKPDQYGLTYGTINGSSNHLIDSLYDGWIDLFGWGTSGYEHGAVCYQPWSISTRDEDYYVQGNYVLNLSEWRQADWGSNPISNGGNMPDIWRTLTFDEWRYLLNDRVTSSGFRYVGAVVNDIRGIILLPDDWDNSIFQLVYEPFTFPNIITAEQWDALENNGAVFLPPTGERDGADVSSCYNYGGYWSSSRIPWIGQENPNTAGGFEWSNGMVYFKDTNRHIGLSVRLVHDIP